MNELFETYFNSTINKKKQIREDSYWENFNLTTISELPDHLKTNDVELWL